MARLTKAQQKRLIREIESKAGKLMINRIKYGQGNANVTAPDMNKISMYCKRWMQQLR